MKKLRLGPVWDSFWGLGWFWGGLGEVLGWFWGGFGVTFCCFVAEFWDGFSRNFDKISDVTDRQINVKINVEQIKTKTLHPSTPQPLDPSTPQPFNPQSLNPSSLNPSTPHLIDR